MFSRALAFGLLAFALQTATAHAADPFVSILTGGTSGVYYPLGIALAKNIGKTMPGYKTSVQATKGSFENAASAFIALRHRSLPCERRHSW